MSMQFNCHVFRIAKEIFWSGSKRLNASTGRDLIRTTKKHLSFGVYASAQAAAAFRTPLAERAVRAVIFAAALRFLCIIMTCTLPAFMIQTLIILIRFHTQNGVFLHIPLPVELLQYSGSDAGLKDEPIQRNSESVHPAHIGRLLQRLLLCTPESMKVAVFTCIQLYGLILNHKNRFRT